MSRITARPDFWNDGERAQAIFKEQAGLKSVIDAWERYRTDLEESRFFLGLAKDEKSEEALAEAQTKVAAVTQGMAEI